MRASFVRRENWCFFFAFRSDSGADGIGGKKLIIYFRKSRPRKVIKSTIICQYQIKFAQFESFAIFFC